MFSLRGEPLELALIVFCMELFRELGKQSFLSLLIYAILFAILAIVEWCYPSLQGVLLQWQDPSFVVGIPASVLGTAYVLTIRNPKNYLGFYPGILMSLLLSVQFYLRGSFDLVILYVCLFTPFLIFSLLSWRKQTLNPTASSKAFTPTFLSYKTAIITTIIALAIVLADYALTTLVIHHDGWGDAIAIKIAGGLMIAASCLANFWMIYKKVDAWFWWIAYCLSGLVFFIMIANLFSIVLFTIMLIVNLFGMIAWIRIK